MSSVRSHRLAALVAALLLTVGLGLGVLGAVRSGPAADSAALSLPLPLPVVSKPPPR